MVLTMPTWGIREVLMLLVALVWTGVTVVLTWRGSVAVETLQWWGILGGAELAIWKIFATPPATGGEE